MSLSPVQLLMAHEVLQPDPENGAGHCVVRGRRQALDRYNSNTTQQICSIVHRSCCYLSLGLFIVHCFFLFAANCGVKMLDILPPNDIVSDSL